MSVSKTELDRIRQQQVEFQDLVLECYPSELGQCAKLLAMYVAIYKQRYGDAPVNNFMQLSESYSINHEMSQIIQDGIAEASNMLRMVRDAQRLEEDSFYYKPASDTIN